MKTKLFGLALMLIGATTFVWTAVIVLLSRGALILIYGLVPLIAGWIVFNSACKSPNTTEKADTEGEIKTGFARIRSFLKGLL